MSAPEVRILTVKQPWAWAIIHGGKDVENRVRNIAGEYRGQVAIHAGLSWDRFWPEDGPIEDAMLDEMHRLRHREPWPWNEHRGAIIGVVDLVDVHHFAECVYLRTTWQSADPNDADLPGGTPIEQETETCSPWAEEGDVFHLRFDESASAGRADPVPGRSRVAAAACGCGCASARGGHFMSAALGAVPMDRSWYVTRDAVYLFEGRAIVHPFAFAQIAAGSDVFERLRLVERLSVERAHARLDALARRLGRGDRSADSDGLGLRRIPPVTERTLLDPLNIHYSLPHSERVVVFAGVAS